MLGLSSDGGRQVAKGFPAWITIPSFQWLAMARHWHFFFAWLLVINGCVYLTFSFLSRHVARDLLPTRLDLALNRPLHPRSHPLSPSHRDGRGAL